MLLLLGHVLQLQTENELAQTALRGAGERAQIGRHRSAGLCSRSTRPIPRAVPARHSSQSDCACAPPRPGSGPIASSAAHLLPVGSAMPAYSPLAASEPVAPFAQQPRTRQPPASDRDSRPPALVLPDPLALLHRPSLDSDSSFDHDDDDDDDDRTVYGDKSDRDQPTTDDSDKERAYLVDPESGRPQADDHDSDDGWDPLSTGRKNRVRPPFFYLLACEGAPAHSTPARSFAAASSSSRSASSASSSSPSSRRRSSRPQRAATGTAARASSTSRATSSPTARSGPRASSSSGSQKVRLVALASGSRALWDSLVVQFEPY